MNFVEDRPGPPWASILIIALAGIALRAVLMTMALPIEVQSDEANYIYLALGLERFGVYFDQHRYLWPPGYPWLLHAVIGDGARWSPDAVRALQVGLSSVIGVTTMLFAWRLFSARAARIAGLIWVVHIPLAAFTHLLWNETIFLALFLPGLWHVLIGLDRASTGYDAGAQFRLLLAGLFLGLALYIKEMPLFLLAPLGVLIGWRARTLGDFAALRMGTIVPLTALVVMLPWACRNQEVYGRFVLSGATLGENVYQGLNARQGSFDTIPLHKERVRQGLPAIVSLARSEFIEAPTNADGKPAEAWARAEATLHPIDRQSVQLERGLAFAAEHPGWAVRTRLKKLSDLVTPLSFFTRHLALGHYSDHSEVAGAFRKPLVLWALLSSVLVLGGAVLGGCLTLGAGPGRPLVFLVLGYVATASLLVSMSRFRIPAEPFLIMLSAGFFAHGPVKASSLRWTAAAAGCVLLGTLWWISAPETVAAAAMALEGRS